MSILFEKILNTLSGIFSGDVLAKRPKTGLMGQPRITMSHMSYIFYGHAPGVLLSVIQGKYEGIIHNDFAVSGCVVCTPQNFFRRVFLIIRLAGIKAFCIQ